MVDEGLLSDLGKVFMTRRDDGLQFMQTWTHAVRAVNRCRSCRKTTSLTIDRTKLPMKR